MVEDAILTTVPEYPEGLSSEKISRICPGGREGTKGGTVMRHIGMLKLFGLIASGHAFNLLGVTVTYRAANPRQQ
jgi:hypothetical protein